MAKNILKAAPLKGLKAAVWKEGVKAHLSEVFHSDNPYQLGSNNRQWWYDGWYDTWRILKYGPEGDEASKAKFVRETLEGVR